MMQMQIELHFHPQTDQQVIDEVEMHARLFAEQLNSRWLPWGLTAKLTGAVENVRNQQG